VLCLVATSSQNFLRCFLRRHTHRDCYENVTSLAEVINSEQSNVHNVIVLFNTEAAFNDDSFTVVEQLIHYIISLYYRYPVVKCCR